MGRGGGSNATCPRQPMVRLLPALMPRLEQLPEARCRVLLDLQPYLAGRDVGGELRPRPLRLVERREAAPVAPPRANPERDPEVARPALVDGPHVVREPLAPLPAHQATALRLPTLLTFRALPAACASRRPHPSAIRDSIRVLIETPSAVASCETVSCSDFGNRPELSGVIGNRIYRGERLPSSFIQIEHQRRCYLGFTRRLLSCLPVSEAPGSAGTRAMNA